MDSVSAPFFPTFVAIAQVNEGTGTPIVYPTDPKTATSLCLWGAVSVGFAFSNQPTPLVVRPDPATAYASVSRGMYDVGVDNDPVTATAIVQQSNTVDPPSPSAQLSFYWG